MNQKQLRTPDDCASSQRDSLGVLFIHGIGEQPEGGTLKQFADPIATSLQLWLSGLVNIRAKLTKQWNDQFTNKEHRDVSAAAPNDRAKRTLESARVTLHGANISALGDAGAAHVRMEVRLKDDAGGALQQSVLLAESWWAQSFVPPTAGELFGWTFKVLPGAAAMHMGDFVRRASTSVFGRTSTALVRLTALLGLILSCLGMLLLPLLVLLLQLVFSATLVLYLLPSSTIRKWVLSAQQGLVVMLGDSFLFSNSPVSRAMMVGKVSQDLAALSASCDRVMIVAHSQGCAVSAAALQEQIPGNLVSVMWLGSGVRKLEKLQEAALNPKFVAAGWQIALLPAVLLFFIPTQLSDWTFNTVYSFATFGVIAIASLLSATLFIVLDTQANKAHRLVVRLVARGIKVSDIYARLDPVPNGSLGIEAAGPTERFESTAVRNRDSLFADHTTYLVNHEEVVLPIGLQLLRRLGLPLDSLVEDSSQDLPQMRRDRYRRLSLLKIIKLLWLISLASAVLMHPELWWEVANRVAQWTQDWFVGKGEFKAFLPLFKPVWSNALLFVLSYLLLRFLWRGLDTHRQQNSFRRRGSSRTVLSIIAALIALVLMLPVYPGLYLHVGFGAGDLLYLSLMLPMLVFIVGFLAGDKLRI